jgi:ribonuclease P protein component
MNENPRQFRLEKKSIIKSRFALHRIFAQGVSCRSRFFNAVALPAAETKIAFTTERGLKSVQRNRLKRLTRELWRSNKQSFSSRAEIAFIARLRAEACCFSLLQADFLELLSLVQGALSKRI